MAHITGGGLPENLPRALAANQTVEIDPDAWEVLPIFRWLAAQGNVSDHAMFNTFNMGIGYVVIVPEAGVDRALEFFADQELKPSRIGTVVPGSGELLGLPE
jgi:phosphoribosylformylglycinamidine cyclo-ligase